MLCVFFVCVCVWSDTKNILVLQCCVKQTIEKFHQWTWCWTEMTYFCWVCVGWHCSWVRSPQEIVAEFGSSMCIVEHSTVTKIKLFKL